MSRGPNTTATRRRRTRRSSPRRSSGACTCCANQPRSSARTTPRDSAASTPCSRTPRRSPTSTRWRLGRARPTTSSARREGTTRGRSKGAEEAGRRCRLGTRKESWRGRAGVWGGDAGERCSEKGWGGSAERGDGRGAAGMRTALVPTEETTR
uniref:Uncharacterized protein n=1 Tax=Oryza barthii TaxID=65489 RepID=A0A0D3ES60_9ORYZ